MDKFLKELIGFFNMLWIKTSFQGQIISPDSIAIKSLERTFQYPLWKIDESGPFQPLLFSGYSKPGTNGYCL